MKIDGNCHCGAIAWEAEVDPEAVYVCHCADCQTISGAAFRWAVTIPEKDFRLLAGDPRTYVKTAESGAESHQLFCPDCAAPLYSYSVVAGPRRLNLRLGTARQRGQLPPRIELWRRSACDWVEIHGARERRETQ